MTIIYLMQWLGPNQQHFQSMYLSNVVIIKLTVEKSENYLITFHNQANENEHVTCMLTVKNYAVCFVLFSASNSHKIKRKEREKDDVNENVRSWNDGRIFTYRQRNSATSSVSKPCP